MDMVKLEEALDLFVRTVINGIAYGCSQDDHGTSQTFNGKINQDYALMVFM